MQVYLWVKETILRKVRICTHIEGLTEWCARTQGNIVIWLLTEKCSLHLLCKYFSKWQKHCLVLAFQYHKKCLLLSCALLPLGFPNWALATTLPQWHLLWGHPGLQDDADARSGWEPFLSGTDVTANIRNEKVFRK